MPPSRGFGRGQPLRPQRWLLALPICVSCLGGASAQASNDSNVTVRGHALLPDRYDCETVSCALYDTWIPVNFTNSTPICRAVQDEMLKNFISTVPDTCRKLKGMGEEYGNCRQDYCAMYDRAVQKLLHEGGPGYYGFDECRALLDFNRTLCETEYRDPQVFCDCLCPMMPLLPAGTCDDEIFQFLLVGRKSWPLQQRHSLSGICAISLCNFFEIIGDPKPAAPPDIIGGVPDICHTSGLPFRNKQCRKMMTTKIAGTVVPYDPCPWQTPLTEPDVLQCSDGSKHKIDPREAETWSVCVAYEYRWTCPSNYPVMCEALDCDGSADHCCQAQVSGCRDGEERICSPILIEDLPEWQGFLTPRAAVARITTTTLDPLQEYLQKTFTTTLPPNLAKEVKSYVPAIVAAVVSTGGGALLVLGFYLTREHFKRVSHSIVGAPRFLKAIRLDPVERFFPTGNEKEPEPLPPLRDPKEVERERLDVLANKSLAEAVDAAYQRGHRGLCAYDGCPPLAEEEPLREAVFTVRMRGLERMNQNPALLQRADTWLRTLDAERALVQAGARARADLLTTGTRLPPPFPGQPWHCTQQGREAQAEAQGDAWEKVERLREAIKAAKLEGAQDVVVKREAELLAQLVARTPELPADRCVLDPEGEGLKLLPKGHRRALLGQTGEAYMYDVTTQVATDVGDDPPPREELGDVGVEAARPVCAEWAKSRRCKAGRSCPWRHVVPQANDTIRECIIRVAPESR